MCPATLVVVIERTTESLSACRAICGISDVKQTPGALVAIGA